MSILSTQDRQGFRIWISLVAYFRKTYFDIFLLAFALIWLSQKTMQFFKESTGVHLTRVRRRIKRIVVATIIWGYTVFVFLKMFLLKKITSKIQIDVLDIQRILIVKVHSLCITVCTLIAASYNIDRTTIAKINFSPKGHGK